MERIGGRHGVELFAALQGRDLHRPTDETALEAEVRRLVATGLSSQDVGRALGVSVQYVAKIIGQGRG